MVWLDICDEQGNAIYFDIYRVERRRIERRWRHMVSGVCGNGLFEVEVLVEPNGQGEVTFIDFSAGTTWQTRLKAEVDSAGLESGLIEAASQHCGLAKSQVGVVEHSPHFGRVKSSRINETRPVWHSVS